MKDRGFGMHAHHAEHAGNQRGSAADENAERESPVASMRDPVCGMQVRREAAAAVRTVRGRNYFFCSDSCVGKFDRNPDRYVAPVMPESDAHAGRQSHAGS